MAGISPYESMVGFCRVVRIEQRVLVSGVVEIEAVVT